VELWEFIWEERLMSLNFFKMDYGGPSSSRVQRYMLDHAMSIKKWVSHHDEMNYHLNQFDLYKLLRSGRLTSLGQSTPQLSIQRLGTLLPQLTTLNIGLRQQLFRIVRLILLLGSFLKISSLNLDVLGA
jgi:hypothetical protein